MLVNRNRNDCACELTLTIWNRNLQLCLGSDPSPSSAPCKVCPEHLPASLTALYAFSAQDSTLSPRQPPHHPPPGAQIPFDSPQALRVFGRALPCPTAEFLQLHKPSASLLLPAQLMCPIPTPSPRTAILRPVPGLTFCVRASREHRLCTRSAIHRTFPQLTCVSSAGRTHCSFHAGWQKHTYLEPTSISLPPDLCWQGCTKTRTLLLACSYL